MNEQSTQTATTTEQAAPAVADAVTEQPSVTDILEAVNKQHFSSTELDAASEAAEAVHELCNKAGIEPVYNFDPDKELPDGYGLAIQPISKREGGKTVNIGVAFVAVPDVETVLAYGDNGEGKAYIYKAALDALLAKVANIIRPRGDSDTINVNSLPFSIHDYITIQRTGADTVAFNKLAPSFVKSLKDKGLHLLTKPLLKQILQSSAFAESQFPSIKQPVWVAIIEKMVALADKEKLDTAQLKSWVENRDNINVQEVEIDLDDLEGLSL